MVKIGVIGFGYWGPNLVRNFFALPNCEIKMIVDAREQRLKEVKKYYPSIGVSKFTKDILRDTSIDAVLIATPVSTHFQIAKEALDQGKHVLIEKPMTSSLHHAQKLVDQAMKRKKVLMVDHTFLYTDAVVKIKECLDSSELGRLNYFDSTRTNLGLFQQDISVLWDLAPHDLSILLYLSSERPLLVAANGVSHTKNRLEIGQA